MKRLILVGMHNKPNKTPLCSSTKTGKILDQILSSVTGYDEVLRTNLVHTIQFPTDKEIELGRQVWVKEIVPQVNDTIVLLGAFVHKNFPYKQVASKIIKVAHPSSTNYRTKEQSEQYIIRVKTLITTNPIIK